MISTNFKFYLFLLFSIFFLNTSALLANEQVAIEDSNKVNVLPRISLITCDSGNELYSTFGHSALRVYYPESGKDIVFNFGLFDFNTPNFYVKFIRGKLKYMLGIQYMEDFVEQFKWEGRSIQEQELILTVSQSKDLIDRLNFLYLPQNRYYYYSFLYKNCTTELRDIIYPLVAQSQEKYELESAGVTFRELLNNCINGWSKFGINLLLGSNIDRNINRYESMFLPENLYEGTALLYNGESPLVGENLYLYKAPESEIKSSFMDVLTSPLVVFSLVFIIMLVVVVGSLVAGKRKLLSIFNNIYLGLVSVFGLILAVIILITEHTELYYNYNLLWCNPFFFLLFLSGLMKWRKIEILFSSISLLFLLVAMLVWVYNIQYVEPGFYPIVLTLALSFTSRLMILNGPYTKNSPSN